MAAKVYYDDDADLSLLKDKTIAIIGYGSQGHAQAQNLRDSGCNVIIGQRPGGPNYDLAISHGFKPVSAAEATKQADMINILLPDEVQADVSGARANGGSFGGAGAAIRNGYVVVNSGYGMYFHMPGNVLLAFTTPTQGSATAN